MITREDYLHFAVRALRGMSAIVSELGDDLANRRPPVTGANSPYVVLHHCLSVIDYWVGHLVAGRPTDRDRDAEFRASGPVRPLLRRVDDAVARLRDDVAAVERFDAPLRATPPADFQGPGGTVTRGGALVHVYEELAQHHGQMEILRDWIVGR